MTSSQSAAKVAAELASAAYDEVQALVDRYADDPRLQVQKARDRADRRLEKERCEHLRVDAMYEAMVELGGDGVVLGVDEVGRGSVAGPLTVCGMPSQRAPHLGSE